MLGRVGGGGGSGISSPSAKIGTVIDMSKITVATSVIIIPLKCLILPPLVERLTSSKILRAIFVPGRQ
ncbi:MAG: hypothetical protein B5M53_08765 [Candidatus Cloacimonas sp. 4484_209]|nr:MAG: hypothetical protein B5M53_08765 [Candidatus Cloacimonas sp. 4484_209]